MNNVVENQNDNSDCNGCTMFEAFNTGAKEPTIIPNNTSGLDDPVLVQNDYSGLNVRAITPRNLSGCPMPELLLQYEATKEPMAITSPGPSGLRSSLIESLHVLRTLSEAHSHKLMKGNVDHQF